MKHWENNVLVAGMWVFSALALISCVLLYAAKVTGRELATIASIATMVGVWVFCSRLKRAKKRSQAQGGGSFKCWRLTWHGDGGRLSDFLVLGVLVFVPTAVVLMLFVVVGLGWIIGCDIMVILLVLAVTEVAFLLAER